MPSTVNRVVPEQRVLEASVLLPEGGAVSGWAGCRWRGVGYLDGLMPDGRTERPVMLCVGPDHDLTHDGADHRGALRHSKDVAREDAFCRVGLEYFKVTGPDLGDPGRIVDRMVATRARARWVPTAKRWWTVEPPPGWFRSPLESMSLDQLLDHRDWLAAGHAHPLAAGRGSRER